MKFCFRFTLEQRVVSTFLGERVRYTLTIQQTDEEQENSLTQAFSNEIERIV